MFMSVVLQILSLDSTRTFALPLMENLIQNLNTLFLGF